MWIINVPEPVQQLLLLSGPVAFFVAILLLIVFLSVFCAIAPRPAFAWGFIFFTAVEVCLLLAGPPPLWDLSPAVGLALGVTSVGCLIEVRVRRLRSHWITGLCALAITGCFFLFMVFATLLMMRYGA